MDPNRPTLNRLNKSYNFGCENTNQIQKIKKKKKKTTKKTLGTKRPALGYETLALGYESSRFWVRNVQTAGYESSSLGTNRLGYECPGYKTSIDHTTIKQ